MPAYDDLSREARNERNQVRGQKLVSKVLYDLGSEDVEVVKTNFSERCNPHPHVFSDRVLRPGYPVYYDILHSIRISARAITDASPSATPLTIMNDVYKRCRDLYA